ETIILKAMAKRPEQRYRTMQELAEDLHSFLEGKPIRARRQNLLSRIWLWCLNFDRILEAGGFMFFLGLVLFIWCCSGLIGLFAGDFQPERPGQFIWHLV